LAEMLMGAEDRTCMPILNRKLLEPKPGFLECQDVYFKRAVEVSKNAIMNNNMGAQTSSYLKESQGLFPFTTRYQSVKNDLQLNGPEVGNPSVWFSAISRYLAIIQSFPKYLSQIDLGDAMDSQILDPMISTGQQMRDVILSLAFPTQ